MVQHPEYPNIPLKEMLCLYDLDQTYDLVLATELKGWWTTGEGDYETYKNSRFFNYLIHWWRDGTLIDYFTCDGAPFADQLGYLLYQFYLPFSGSISSPLDNYTDIDIAELYQTLASVVDWENYIAVEIQLPAGSGKGTICYYLDETQACYDLPRLHYPAYCLNKKVIHYELKPEPQTIHIPFDDDAFPVIGTFVCGGDMAAEVEASIPSIWLYDNLPSLLEWLDARVRTHWGDREMVVGGYNWTFNYEIKSVGTTIVYPFWYGFSPVEYFSVTRPNWYYFCWHITANNRGGQLVERPDTYSNPIKYYEQYGQIEAIAGDLRHKNLYYNYKPGYESVYRDYSIVNTPNPEFNSQLLNYFAVVIPEVGTEPANPTGWDIGISFFDSDSQQFQGISTYWGWGIYTPIEPKPFYEVANAFPSKAISNHPLIVMHRKFTAVQWQWIGKTWYGGQLVDEYNATNVDIDFRIFDIRVNSGGSNYSIQTFSASLEAQPNKTPVPKYPYYVTEGSYSGTTTLTHVESLTEFLDPTIDYSYTFDQFIQYQDLTIMVDSQRIKEIHAALQADKFAWMPNTTDTLRNANLGYYIERIARVLGISVKPDGSLRTIRPKKFIKAGEVIPAGWYGGCFGINNGGSTEGQPGGTPDEERDGIVYEIKCNNFDGKQTIEAGGYALCENWIQYLDAMQDDLDKALGWQDLGAMGIKSADGTRLALYEGLADLIKEALFIQSSTTMNTSSTQTTAIATHQMVRELIRVLGIPNQEKFIPVDIGEDETSGYVNYAGYPENTPTLADFLFAILTNIGYSTASNMKVKPPQTTP